MNKVEALEKIKKTREAELRQLKPNTIFIRMYRRIIEDIKAIKTPQEVSVASLIAIRKDMERQMKKTGMEHLIVTD